MIALRHVIVSGAVAAITLATAHPARAANDAASLLQRGIAAFDKASFAKARELLTRAARAAPGHSSTAAKAELYLGLTHAVEGHMGKAKAAFALALAHDPLLDIDRKRFPGAVASAFDQARATLHGTLAIAGVPADGHVLVDGKAATATSKQPIGRHGVVVTSADGKQRVSKTAVVRAGETTKIAVTLPGAAPATTTQPGPTGDNGNTHAAGGSNDGHGSVPPKPSRGGRLWTWIALGGAAVMGAVAIGTWVKSGSVASDWQHELDAPAPDPQRIKDLESKTRTFENVSFVFDGLAGALAITSLVLFFVEGKSSPSDEQRSAHFSPLLGPGLAGARINLRF